MTGDHPSFVGRPEHRHISYTRYATGSIRPNRCAAAILRESISARGHGIEPLRQRMWAWVVIKAEFFIQLAARTVFSSASACIACLKPPRASSHVLAPMCRPTSAIRHKIPEIIL
jgi:hypothetical protein